MLYFSTRDASQNRRSFCEIVLEGLAPDGGLYIPESIPKLTIQCLKRWSFYTYPELAAELLRLYAPELEQEAACSFQQLASESSRNFRNPEVTPLLRLGESPVYVGELFHGPTYAFKDLALQFLGPVFERLLQSQGRKLYLLGATSGDTGGAAIYGMRGLSNIQLTILHPYNAISIVQRKQMCSVLEDNICNIAIQGNFDQCQNIVKEIMTRSKSDTGIPKLGAINSINWGRILAQMTYYFALYFRTVAVHPGMQIGKQIRFVVPTGNFGNALAGYFARIMGLPIELVLATNQNDILHQCIRYKRYQPKKSIEPSLAPAMDIVQPSNWERYLWYLLGGNTQRLVRFLQDFSPTREVHKKENRTPQFNLELSQQLNQDFSSCNANDRQILQAIVQCYSNYGYTLDPHTACAYYAVLQLKTNIPSVCLGTAHPAKFPEVYQLLPSPIPLETPAGLQFENIEEHYCVLDCDSEIVREYLQHNIWD